MSRLNYEVSPMWKFLQGHCGMEEAFSVFGPYEGANIKVKRTDPYTLESSMQLVLRNTNYVGTHFGGSLYSMCDPFFMFLLIENLGEGYIVWDKSASIDFLRPGKGLVKAVFHIPPEELRKIKEEVDEKKKMDWSTRCEIIDEEGKQVAEVKKVLYIRKMK